MHLEHEHKCGVGAVVDPLGKENIGPYILPLLEKLETRGPGASGLAFINKQKKIALLHREGLASQNMEPLRAKVHAAIFHNLYQTTPDSFPHPYIARHGSWQIAMAFNGNIPSTSNEADARNFLSNHGLPCESRADTEMLAKYLVWHMNDTRGKAEEAFRRTQEAFPDGSFNVAFLTQKGDVHAYRDMHGRHPLVWGQTNQGLHALASESSALTRVWDRAEEIDVSNVQPGMSIHFGKGLLQPEISQIIQSNRKLCAFEFSYFANRLSEVDGTSVHKVRYMSGEDLATQDKEWLQVLQNEGRMPIAVGVPESSKIAADGYADKAHIRRVDALLRNPKIDRSFIAEQSLRQKMLEQKFEIDWEMLHDRDVVLIDDSCVRGTTMKTLIEQMRDPPSDVRTLILKKTGKEYCVRIHVRFAYPPVMAPCYHGINFPTVAELLVPKVAGNWLPENGDIPSHVDGAVAASIGAQTARFLTPRALHEAIGRDASEICGSCYTREYESPRVQQLFQLQIPKIN